MRSNRMNQDFAEFYAAHFAQVAAQLYAYLGDRGEAQDLTQEAFCRALDRWKTVSAYDQPLAWVRQVAWNLAKSRMRHLQVVMRHAARERPQHVEGPGPDRVVLVNALAALPANHRLAVVLHHIGDLSTSEIAQQHGVAEGTVRSWLSRGRSQLAEDLKEWRPQFAPPGAEAAEKTVRRRRVGRRSALAGLVLLLAIGFAAVVLRGGGEPPIITPTPTPTPSGTRRVSLPGVDISGPPAYTKFIDSRNAWVMLRECGPTGQPPCRHAVGVTDDTAATWRTISLPFVSLAGNLQVEAVDTRTVILTHILAGETADVWITRDGGTSFQYHDFSAASPDLKASVRGGLGLRCADDKPVTECRRWNVVDHSAGGSVLSEVPFGRGPSTLFTGGDGRLWLWEWSATAGWVAVSQDRGRSWRELPWPESGDQLQLTPDGRGVWVTGPADGGTAFWELDGDRWQRRMVADVGADSFQPLLLDGGVWLVAIKGKLFYLKNGARTEIPGITGVRSGQVLGDGSVLVQVGADYTLLVGVGSGTDRAWTRIAG